ncbi:MAG: hypothetical protein ACK47B_00125 [Armatimonadota bacterium]
MHPRYLFWIPLLLGTLALGASAKTETPTLEISPDKVTLQLGEGRQFKAKVKGRDVTVKWEVAAGSVGAVTQAGYYQAPSEGETPATIRVLASTTEEPALKADALVFLQPVALELKPGKVQLSTAETYQFQAKVTGTGDQRVRWSVDGGDDNGRISASGLYAAPPRFLTPGTATIRATSLADPSKSATATVEIGAISIEVTPKEAQIQHGETRRFMAKVQGTSNTSVEWKVLGKDQGEVSDSGLYSTPATMTTPSVVTIVATSVADPTKSASVQVKVAAIQVGEAKVGKKKKKGNGGVIGVSTKLLRAAASRVSRIYLPFNPLDFVVKGPVFRGKSGKLYVPLGGGVPLDVNVSNSTNDRLVWELEGLKLGELSADGFYQAPEKLTTPQVVQVRATSVADPSKSVLYTLHIPHVVVEAKVAKLPCQLGGAVQLAATVENTENDRVLWSVEGGDAFGSISETGLYHPPARISTPAVVRVRAASAADPTKFTLLQVDIQEAKVELSPGSAELKPGQSVRLKTKVKGCVGNPEVVWKLTPEVGSITPDGVYVAPEAGGAQVVQVTASLKCDPTKTAAAAIRVKP